MAEVVNDLDERRVNRHLDRVEQRAIAWWEETQFPAVLVALPVPQSLREWIKRVAIQAWVEGAVTATQEYSDELRELGRLSPRADEK